MNEDKKQLLIKQLSSVGKIEFPNYQIPSIPREGLIVAKEQTKVEFKNGEFYNKFSHILHLNGEQSFKGEIIKGKKYILVKGEYKWPSGQIFSGTFDKNNNKIEGILKYKEGYIYKGKFKYEKFNGEGEFKWNENEFIKGNFVDGNINGKAKLKRENYNINGNFIDSKAEGEINDFNIELNGHSYLFPKFNLKNGEIEEEKLIINKDNKNIILNKGVNKNINIESNYIKINPTDDDLFILNKCFNIINDIIPKYEIPSIPEEGLILKEGTKFNIKFGNGVIMNINEEEDEHSLYLSNKEKLIKGRLENDENGKYWLKEGKYIWPSGQEYLGGFNKNNKFESDDAELKIENKWIYNGGFKNGKLNGHGRFDFENNNYLESYFSDGKLEGLTIIKFENIKINGFIQKNEFDIKLDNNSYKIIKLKGDNNDEKLLIIEKNEKEYFIIHYFLNEGKQLTLIEYDVIDIKEKNNILSYLNAYINIPEFEPTSINNDGLIVENNINKNEIFFENGIIYNKEKELLILPNKEIFKGKIKKISNKYVLDEGEYEWPNGQKYIGKFNENNNFEGDENSKLVYENKWTYQGGFKNGEPNGKGEIKKDNGDYIKGNFENGKIFGETIIKKDDIILEGNYISSIINGTINNINTIINNHNYQISNITINKGSIQEDIFYFQEDNDGNKQKVILNESEKEILPKKYYNIFDFDEKDLKLIFKSLSKIRKINLPYFSSPLMSDGEEVIQDKNNKDKFTIIFPNKELFVGKIEKNNEKYLLKEGEYIWPFGQRYIGKFRNNKFDSENAELTFKNEWIYEGGFKNGYFEGNGIFRNIKGHLIKGYFEKGKINNDVTIEDNNYYFKGSFLDTINDIYIKVFNILVQNHIYELSEFKLSDNKIIFKKDKIEFIKEISPELKIKMIELLIIKPKYNKKIYFYYEPFKERESNENQIKILKIQDNIQSQKLSTLSINYTRLSKQNRKIRGKIGKLIGVNLNKKLNLSELIYKIKENKNIHKNDIMHIKQNINNFHKMEEVEKDDRYNRIEENEIIKVCNSKMIKDIQSEIDLINKDIKTMKKEREKIEKVKYNKYKEINDLKYYYELINEDYNEINNIKIKLEIENNKIEENINDISEKNMNIKEYLNNIKNDKPKKKNKTDISKEILKLENYNNKLLFEINKKEAVINNGNKEIEKLLIEIMNLDNKIEKQKLK